MKGLNKWFPVLAVVVILWIGSSQSQVTTGVPPYQSFAGGPDVINLGNLNVHYSIPVFSRPGRGTSFSYALAYDSSIWTPSGTAWLPNNGGLQRDTAALVGYVKFGSSQIICHDPEGGTGYRTAYNFGPYVDTAGTSHAFLIHWEENECLGTGPTSGTAVLADGSGITVYADDGPGATVILKSGQIIYPQLLTGGSLSGGGTLTDTNGNQMTSATANGTTTLTDTLGTTALTITGTAPNPVYYKYPAPSGAQASVTVTYVTKTVQTNFGCSGISEYGPLSNSLVDKITLADGSYYQFTYEQTPIQGSTNVTGRIASVRLPTGGVISYTYTGGDTGKGIMCADGSTAGFTRTTPDTPTGQSWSYIRTGSRPAFTTTVTTPLDPVTGVANVSKIQFQQVQSQGNYETQRDEYQGAASGTSLRTSYTCYNGNGIATPSTCPTLTISSPFQRITSFLSLNGGSLSESDTTYDGYGNVTETDTYDFGVSTPARKAAITYGGTYNAGTNTCAALANNILNRPCKVTVADGSGNLKGETTYGYDETAVVASGITTNHISVSGSRGNTTNITTYTTSTGTLVRTFKNYDTGLVYQSQDVNGQWTTNIYGACAGAFLTSVSLPLNLTKSSTWNCSGGVATSSTDENGQISYVNYTADPYFWRPESTKDALLNVTNLSYSSLTQNRGYLNFNGTASTVDVTATLDLLGRGSYTQQKQGQSSSSYDTVQQTYDSFGRPFQATMAYVATTTTNPTPPSGTPVGSTYYDAIGRPIKTIDSGGGTVHITYNQNDVYREVAPAPTVPPAPGTEGTKRRQLQYDGLGRLTSACEVTNDATFSGNCAQTNSLTGFYTTYAYDTSPNFNSLTVTQSVQKGTSQTRVYVYDMLGRLTSETNPETSNFAYTYTYDSDSTCGTYKGDVVKRVDANGNVTCYSYDALHRLLSVTYPSGPNHTGTSQKHFVYDSATVNSQTMQYAKSRLAEAYTCTTCPGTKLSDLGFSYDKRGGLTDVYQSTTHSAGYYHATASYWAHGALNTLGLLSSASTSLIPQQTYGLEGEGRPVSVSAASGQSPVSAVSYMTSGTTQPIGSLQQVTLGSGDKDNFTYDPNTGRPTEYKFSVGSTPSIVKGDLTWNANGSLAKLAITDPFDSANAQTCTFGYDDLSRLSSANCGSAWSQTFTFDPFGNASKSGTSTFEPGWDLTRNWFLPTNAFDSNGNLKSDVAHTYTWDAENKLMAVDSVTLTFDALGRMVEQARGSSYTQIVYSPTGGKVALMSGQALQKAFVGLPGGGTAVYNSSGLAYYRHPDWLGSSRLATLPTQTNPSINEVYNDGAYAPYGENYAGYGTSDLDFTGQNQDTVSGLHDFLYREYSPTSSRWIQPDPAGMSAVNLENPQTWNRYAYLTNMPLAGVDRLGLMGPCGEECPYFWLYNRGSAYLDSLEFSNIWELEWNGERWQRTAWYGLVGGDIPPWDRDLRSSVVSLLRQENDCSNWFNTGKGSAPDIMSNVPILLGNPSSGWRSPPDANTPEGPAGPITVAPDGRFYANSKSGIPVGGVADYNGNYTGGYRPGSNGARMIILLHELAHKVGGLIAPDGPLAEGPTNQSDINTGKVMQHCQKAVDSASH